MTGFRPGIDGKPVGTGRGGIVAAAGAYPGLSSALIKE
jgi:hypothetical protein